MILSRLLIDGVLRPASGDRTFAHSNPASGQIVTRAAAASTEDAQAAAAAAAAAFVGWAGTDPADRRARLLAVVSAMAAREAEFLATVAAETGASGPEIRADLHHAAEILRDAAGLCAQVAGDITAADAQGRLSIRMARPRGVCLGIAPARSPIAFGVRAAAAALALGNTVVLKASTRAPGTHCLIGQCFLDAGMPPGVLNVIQTAPGDAAQIAATLIHARAVRHVSFTGSHRVGRIIGRLAGEALKPVLVDLPGETLLVVLDDADVDAAVVAAMGPVPVSRAIVDDTIASAFAARLPHIPLVRVRGAEAALRAADDGGHVLTCALFGRDLGRALKLAERIPADTCHINGLPHDDPGADTACGFTGQAAIAAFTAPHRITIPDPLRLPSVRNA